MIGLAVLSVSACTKVLGVDFDDVAPLSQTGSDGSTAACDLALPNPPPDLKNTGGTQEATVIASTIEWGEDASDRGKIPPAYGFDVDGVCANLGDPPPCTAPAYTKGDPTDGPHGEDNSVSKMVGGQWTSLGLSDPPLTTPKSNAAVKDGRFAPLLILHVSDWIGVYDDEQVTVEWYVGLPANDDPAGQLVPKLDGTDTWPLLAKTPGSSEPTKFVDPKAYVAGHKVVAHFPSGLLPLTTAYLTVQDVVITAEIARDTTNTRWILKDGVAAGRAYSHEVLLHLPDFTNTLLGFPLCTNISTYNQQIKPWVCGTSDSLLPGAPAGSACNGISFGIGFQGVEVTLGDVGDQSPGETCSPEYDPANDDCSIATPGP